MKKILILLMCFVLLVVLSEKVIAANVTWTGGGTDNLASNPANWSGNVVPQYGDDVVFDSTAKDCTWDLTVTVASLSIKSGYIGKVTKISGVSLTIKTPTYVSGVISADTRWTLAGSPYIVTGDVYVYGTTTEPTLTIEPGVVVKFSGTGRLYIGYGDYKGVLNAQGTSSAPILFTSTTPAPGTWYGIWFSNHATTESILDYVTVEYGGGGYGGSQNIYLYDSSPTIKNSTIRYSGDYGIRAVGDSSPTITNTSFTNNGSYALSIPANVTLGTGNTFSGNSIELMGGIISTDTTWRYVGVPYIVTGGIYGGIYVYGTTTEPTLTIEPGVVVKFNGTGRLYIGYGDYKGVLNAQGTSSAPILFTSTTPAPGTWYGIWFSNHATTESILDYVTVEYGGGGYGGSQNIYLYDSSPTIKNSTIRYSGDYGIRAVGDSAPTILSSTISNNTNYAVYSESSILKVNHCNITGNGNGIYSPIGKIVDARFNWWGDVSGPSGEGSGTGQSVSSGINFEPWLGTTYTYPFYNTNLNATLQEFSPLNNLVIYTFSISENSTWTFLIKNSGGITVRTFSGPGTIGTVIWDGKDEGGLIVPDGIYTYQLSSTSLSSGSQSAPFIGDVTVNSALPKAEIAYPVNEQFIIGSDSFNIQGTATDTDFNNYKVEYGLGTSPTTWTLITSSTTPVNAGTLATWDTSYLPGTYYTIRLSVTDNAGNTATASVEIKLLNIYSISVSEPYFSPNGDSSKDTTTITASITYPSNWTVDIKNSVGTVVRTFTGTGTSISVTWDGKDTSGIIQPDGIYSYTITAIEQNSGTIAIKDSTSNITIDLTPPIAQITSPVANQDVYEAVTITGTASDTNEEYYYLYYGEGTNPTIYTQFATGYSNVTNGTLGTWNTRMLSNGIYTLKLLVMDKAGNSIETTVPVTVKNASLSNFTASVNFNPASNQSSAISYTLAEGGLITIRVGTYASYFRTLIQNAKRPAGDNVDYWDGRNDLGELVPAGSYLIAIYTTTDPNPMPVTAPRTTNPLSTPARFDPTTDIGATISYTLSKLASVTVGIYDFNDNLIRNVISNILQSQGNNSVIWDGKNDSGNYAYPGAYRYKITATDSDNVTGPEVTGIVQVYY